MNFSWLSCGKAGLAVGFSQIGGTGDRRALISVSDKTGALDFAKGLLALGYGLVSTGGTYGHIRHLGGVVSVEDATGFPEILGGRVKTLHPKIHGGILARRDESGHMAALGEHGIPPIDLVAVNLYPFAKTLGRRGATEEEIIENIDIGGVALIRSAAKNHASVTVVVDPEDYPAVLDELAGGGISPATRKALAAKAFRHTAEYDSLIAWHLNLDAGGLGGGYPEKLTMQYELKQKLRYGENPHQSAAIYKQAGQLDMGIFAAQQLHGIELSYNNAADADMALGLIAEFAGPACAVIKHQNPCGVGLGETAQEAFREAHAADPVSIFGGIVAFNREVDEAAALLLKPVFLEIILAPAFSPGALGMLRKKKNLRLLRTDRLPMLWEHRLAGINGGLLVQDADTARLDPSKFAFPTQKKPTDEEMKWAQFAWKVAKHAKSNAIVVAKGGRTLGIGAGQTSRVGAAKIALAQAGGAARGAALASDAMLPMPDTAELAADAGISAIIQTGGSVKDEEVIAACDRRGVAMAFTGLRHFRH